MESTNVEIVRLTTMRLASVQAYGPNPEELAWQHFTAWAAPRGLLDGVVQHAAHGSLAAERVGKPQIFGFNNPNPSVGSPNYGYEYWLTVTPEVEPVEGVRIVETLGGLYAVLTTDVSGNYYETIPAAWQRLDTWVAGSIYRPATHQWLEEHSADGVPFAFYYPISE